MNLKNTVIGIELGSTRIKAVMLDKNHQIIAQGGFEWENKLKDGIWTYSYDLAVEGLSNCFALLKKDFEKRYDQILTTTGSLGISAMMHGYIPLDESYRPLCNFRTWRNTITGEAAEKLTELFNFNVPQRWSVAHLYQAFLNKEKHVEQIKHLMTLSSYMHYLLTGENVIGIDDASGMFPIDSKTLNYDKTMATKFKTITGFDVYSVFPKVLIAGQKAGSLTKKGASILDKTGTFESGIIFAAPEGDAGTGMVATNSVRKATGNVSAGTSDFAMVVTDKELNVHKEIDMVTTPSGLPVAMVHCNNCTTDINSWINLFGEFAQCAGLEIDKNNLYSLLYSKALEGSADCGGLLSCNYYSGEGITDFDSGIPIFIHKPDSEVHLADFMRLHMMSAMATLKIGMDILKIENVKIDKIYGHGGFFKTPMVGQRILSAAISSPVSVMENAGEGGPYGMALLCAYLLWGNIEGKQISLEDYLDKHVFDKSKTTTIMASDNEINGFNKFIENYKKLLLLEEKSLELFT